MKDLLERIKDVFSLGPNYYHGHLYSYFREVFKKLEKGQISEEKIKQEVKNIFMSNEDLRKEFLQKTNPSKNLTILGNSIKLFEKIRIGVIHVKNNEYEPMHLHEGFSSIQIVLKGECELIEADKINLEGESITFKLHQKLNLKEGDVMINTPTYRCIHGFGSLQCAVYVLSITKSLGLFGKFKFNSKISFIPDRHYIDIDNKQEIEHSVFRSQLISRETAESKYLKKSS